MSVMPGSAAAPPVTEKREFWVLMGYAAALATAAHTADVARCDQLWEETARLTGPPESTQSARP